MAFYDAFVSYSHAKDKPVAAALQSVIGIATAFLAHDAARLITGETLYIDGGYHIID